MIIKSIKISMLTKKYIALLADIREEYLSQHREELKNYAYGVLYALPQFQGLSLALSVGISYSQIIADAFNHFISVYTKEEQMQKISDIIEANEQVEEDVGNLIIKFTFSEDVYEALNSLCNSLKPAGMRRPYRMSFMLGVLVKTAYEDNIYKECVLEVSE